MSTQLVCQLFGERCTGTNYVSKLIVRNTNIVFRPMAGYKHSFPTIDRFDGLVVIVTRNVYDWVRSLHLNPWGANQLRGLSLDEFLRAPWVVYYDAIATDDPALIGTELTSERCPDTQEPFTNVMKLRSSKYAHWLRFGARSNGYLIVQQEYAYSHAWQLIDSLNSFTGVEVKDEFTPVTDYKGRATNGPYIPKNYQPLTNDQVDWINSQLDGVIEDALGYKLQRHDRFTEAMEG